MKETQLKLTNGNHDSDINKPNPYERAIYLTTSASERTKNHVNKNLE